MEGIANGGALGEGLEVSVLVEGALGWSMLADLIEVAKGDECRWNQREVKMVVFEDPVIPFVSLLMTRYDWRRSYCTCQQEWQRWRMVEEQWHRHWADPPW